ncbi:two-component regulator propeller domain-containing protein [Stenotrophomonas sp. HITSZ_GD]|uniref:ligand-binding sensor domain-containing diguanylate cyclase n=1 Tax=Stenotrophomonas sp. HITSZ_GD TaxID=3037248 RepID=UPI00240D09F3|nr:ligand-binding sensor domain-containing diguanylate cyclase [Stenotrophomonas sp. HITSZ_GD]MDG2526742.1 two-component regulator propeller domain-containing protein [Stenotrophomonas sp. HITSZ_GD]
MVRPWQGGLWLLLAALLGLCAGRAPAANPGTPPLRDYAIDVWTSREGLPHNSIRAIAQTAEGHLWFATWEGLVRYNGLDFTVFDRGTRPGLLDNGVGTLFIDNQGHLWLSDSRGDVGRFDPASNAWRWWPHQDPAPQVIIQGMQADSQGRLWLLFEGNGLGYLGTDGKMVYQPSPPDMPLTVSYMRLAVDARDRVWVGTFDGLVYRDTDGSFHRAPAGFHLPPGLAWPYMAPDGALWFAAGDGLYRLEDGEAVLKHRVPGQGHLTALLQDRRGELWVGTENNGLFRIGRRGVERFPPSVSIPGGRISSLFEDAEGSIWVGANAGLFRLRETLIANVTRRDGLSGDYTRSVLEDRLGRLWVGSSTGLDVVELDGHIRHYPLPESNGRAPAVLSLAEDREGRLWVGTYGDGVYRIDGANLRHFGFGDNLPAGNIRAITVDEDGTVWLGTQHGVVAMARDQPRLVRTPGVPTGLITALASSRGALWIGTIQGAYLLRDDGQVAHPDLEALGGARTVFGFHRAGADMWISSDRGLYRYRDGQLARVGLEQGMPVDAVFQMVADHDNNVWISSNRGLMRTQMATLNAVAKGRERRIAVEHFNEMDGMANSQGNGSSAPSALVRRDGTVWVATAGGLATLDPVRLDALRERTPPPPVIESVQVDGQPQGWQEAPRLRVPGRSRVSVTYVGLSYLLSERIEYRTRLEGLDSEWIERGRQRNVEFIGLAPGQYILHVSARHPGGRWSEREAVLRFSIAPLWWQRHDVQAIAALALVLLLVALYRFGIQRYKRRNERLAELVRERTQDLQQQAQRLLLANQEKSELLTRLRLRSDAFERQAHEDALTGLPNRRQFDEALARDLSRARRSGRLLSLVILDIDHFKLINDRHSHATGDAVLHEVGALLTAACRASDLPARLGGEEFAILLSDTPAEEAERVCARIRELFHARSDWGGIEGLRVTFSAGVAELREDESGSSLLQRADHALYEAKSDGRDRIRIG